ncbi:hypothetical protein [Amycolatopsis sp. NPDC051371]|uniref:hypothetical protein n=1 Tax=Amycolatopsis sp. NPDC051371 TaxID=3155800 RepID=UPI0034402F93
MTDSRRFLRDGPSAVELVSLMGDARRGDPAALHAVLQIIAGAPLLPGVARPRNLEPGPRDVA